MKEKFYRLFLKLTNPEAYGALLECDRLSKAVNEARRLHEKSSDIQKRLYETRAIFETLRAKKR